MPSRAKVFTGDASVTATMHPWISTPPWMNMGAFIGYELGTGRVVLLDLQMLKKLQIIHSLVLLVLGAKNHGKSALVKSLCLRLLCLQAGIIPGSNPPQLYAQRARLHDRKPNNGKGEYTPIAEHLLSDSIDLAQFGSLNLFDPLMGMTELDLVETALNVAETINHGQLPVMEVLAIQTAIHKMYKEMRSTASAETLELILRSQDGTELDSYFSDTNDAVFKAFEDRMHEQDVYSAVHTLRLITKRPHNIDLEEYRKASGKASLYFGRLLRADYGKVFGGYQSLREVLTSPMSHLNWTGVTGKPGHLLEAMMYKWQKIALDRNDLELMPTVNLADEEHSALKNITHARFRDEYIRKARAFPTIDITITQYPTDLTQVGDAGSELRDLGMSINKGVGLRFWGKQENDDETLHEITRHGVSDEDAEYTTQLSVGCWGILAPGQKMRWVRHALLPSEVNLVESNSANDVATNRLLLTDHPEVQSRLMRLGAVQIGADAA